MTDNSITSTASQSDTQSSIDCVPREWIEKYLITQIQDTCGTRCPIPLLRAKKALKLLSAGDYLLVLATDPSAKGDFDAMLKHLPHELVEYHSSIGDEKRVDYFLIQKGS